MKVDPGLAGRLIEQEARWGVHDRRPLDVVCGRGDGVYLWDVQGNRLMDFLSGHGPGHTHTRIASAMVEQCLRLTMTSGSLRNDRLPPFLDRLCTLTGFEAALLLGSEAQALETAFKAAGLWAAHAKGLEPGQAEILGFTGHDHGHSDLGPPWLRRVPFGDLGGAKAALGPCTCAVLVEPVQKQNVRVPPRGFLKGLRELCDREGLLLLVDETASGLGRTGRLFAFEHEGIRPDGLILGKALAGGFLPLGAFCANRELMDLFTPHNPASAFGGHPLACAVAGATLEVLADERLADRAAELGAYFLARLRAMECPRLSAIHGLGLWAGLELREGGARYQCEALALEGLLCDGSSDQTLLLVPPLVITREQLDWALERLERVLGRPAPASMI